MAEQLARLNKGDLEVCSTDEKQIGVWTDGKPLYRKVIQTTTPSNATDTLIATLPNNYLVKNLYGSIKQGNNNYMPLAYIYDNAYVTTYYQFSPQNGIRMRSTHANTQNCPCEIVIEYTKQ